jgi:hypothetical protein
MPVLITAFQKSAFQNNAFQIQVTIPPTVIPFDLDQGGFPRQWITVALGPGLGRTKAPLRSVAVVNTPGTFTVPASVTVIEVNAAGPVTVILPPATGPAVIAQNLLISKRPVMVMDISGNASTNNITIVPLPGENIVGLSSLVIKTNYGGVTLTPSQPLGGWSLIKGI